MSDYKDLFSNSNRGSGGGWFDFEPGSLGSYWWRATKILYVIGVIFALLAYGHTGFDAFLAAFIIPAIIAPFKALFWGGIFWFFSRLFR